MSESHTSSSNAEYQIMNKINECSMLSLILGITLLIMAPITLNFNVNLWSEGPTAGQTAIPMNLAYPGGIVSIILLLTVSLTSIILAVKG